MHINLAPHSHYNYYAVLYKWTDNTYFLGIDSDATFVAVVPWKAARWRQNDAT